MQIFMNLWLKIFSSYYFFNKPYNKYNYFLKFLKHDFVELKYFTVDENKYISVRY